MNETECKPEPVIPTEEERLDQLKRSRNYHRVRCCMNCAFRDESENDFGGIGETFCGKDYDDSSVPPGEDWTYDVSDLDSVCDCHRFKDEYEKEDNLETRLTSLEVRIEDEMKRLENGNSELAYHLRNTLKYILSGDKDKK